MKRVELLGPTIVCLVAIGLCASLVSRAVPEAVANDGRNVSLAAFARIDEVLSSPRCQNCHTLGGFPRQGNDRHPHLFNVMRGPDGHGAKGLACATCHGRANNAASGVPGADGDWHLAPLAMGWEGLTPALRCAHLKDASRNGGRNGTAVIDHLKTALVAWAWQPGDDARNRPRTPPPVPYDEFLKIAELWINSGAACPEPN